ncbi:MAG: PSD1 and planctomycete cytochrome C domain-containing protein [Planctomycetaceae bacterium]
MLLTLARLCPVVADDTVDYTRDIKPILRERCYACHGVLKSESGLRLDTAAFALAGGDSGPVIVPEDAELSLVLARITAEDLSERMPPEGEPLTPAQITLIREWISQGAHAPADEHPEEDPREHWSFRHPERPPVPEVTDAAWTQNPMDAFIARAHDVHGLTPRPPADKSILLRRVFLDLTGLPPTRDELHSFLADTSPDAYERVVGRLLDSPQYGERWARHWMDVWRYADWFGRRMVPDVWNSAPQIWRWRDWIVSSLNADKSYARMIQEMLAADEIAPDDPDAAVATGYLIRNWYALNPNDWMRSNVEHTAKAFLALTYNCAHCHDHKYDPIAQDDYFRMRAFFEPIGIRQDRVPGEADPGPFQEYEYSVLRKIARLGAVSIYDKHPDAPTWFYAAGDERQRNTERGTIAPGFPVIFRDDDPRIEPVTLPPSAYYPASRPAIQATLLEECRRAVAVCEQALADDRRQAAETLPGLREQLAAADANLSHLEKGSTGSESGSAADSSTGAAERAATVQQSINVQDLTVRVAESKALAAQAELASVEARIAADRVRSGEAAANEAEALIAAASAAERAARLRTAESAVAEQERLLAVAESKPADDAKRQEAFGAAAKKLEEVRDALQKAHTAAIPSTYTPLGPVYPAQSTGRRKVLAEWIGSRENPLTARVAINHIWMRHFQAPLVSTVFDFGRNGAPPTHPELLDWLAVELMDSGWSMKHVHRLIVTSRTYQMASSQGDDAGNAERDPQNRFLWRMNVGRMEAEVVRDSLLFCAEKLDTLIGGQELENKESLTTFRRSLYYSCQPEVDGKSPLGTLFDAPDANECYRRTRSVVPQQALALANSDLVHSLSVSLADLLCQQVARGQAVESDVQHSDWAALVTAAFEHVLSRSPTPDELTACEAFLNEQRRLMNKQDAEHAGRRAAQSLIRVLFNHNDFVAIR